jgi:hypothetical protein
MSSSKKDYCQFNSYCVNPRCNNIHYHNKDERILLLSIINKSPEIADYKEGKISKPMCKDGLRCNVEDCTMRHGLEYDGRVILINKYNREMKILQIREKLRKEINEYRRGVSYDWNDLDPRP